MLLYGYAGVEYNKKIYFSTEFPVGCLYCFDPDSGSTKFIKQFYVEKRQNACHGGAVLYQDTAWFIPWNTCRVACMNLNSMEESYFDILNHSDKNGHAFIDYFVCGNKLFLIPCGDNLDTLMIIDMKEQKVQYFQHIISGSKCIGAYIWQSTLYFVSPEGNVISEFDLNTQEIKRIGFENQHKVQMYTSVLQNKKMVYFIPTEVTQVLAVNLETGERKTIEHPQASYRGGTVVDNGILLYPGNDKSRFLRINMGMNSNSTSRIEYQCGKDLNGWLYMEKISSDRNEHLIMGTDGEIYLFDQSGELKDNWRYTAEADELLQNPKLRWEFMKEELKGENPLEEAPGRDLFSLFSVVLGKNL